MRAIKLFSRIYEIIKEEGDFYYGKDKNGRVKLFPKESAIVIEIDKMPRSRSGRSNKSKACEENPIETWKNIALSVNDKWNSNSTWKLAEESFGKLNTNGNEFIESLLDSMFKRGRLSEKQAYYLAKYAVESGQLR